MSRRFTLFLAVFVSVLTAAPCFGVTIAFLDDDTYVDQDEEAAHLRTSLVNLGHTVNNFTGATTADFTTALAGADALVVSELQNADLYAAMDAGARTLVTDFVRNGGNFIITSRIDRASSLINGLFGKTVSSGTAGVTSLSDDDALGTSFEGGPASLSSPSAVQGASIASLPSFALSIYQNGSGGATVFVFPEDAGSVIYLGFDWFATPTSADWETVLAEALAYESNVWDGSTDGNWSTDANWSSNDSPADNERAVFAGSTNTTVNHDNPADTAYAGIAFASNAGAFVINGNRIALTDGATVTNRSANTQTFNTDILLANADVTVTADTAAFAFNGNIALNGTSALTVTGSQATTVAGNISGAGSIVKTGSGMLWLTGTNSYTGGTTVSAGSLVGTSASLQGDITNNAAVVFSQSTTGTYAGVLSGTGTLTKIGSGTLTLTGNNTYSGGTTLNVGTLILGSTSAVGTGDVTMGGGVLRGVATLGDDLFVNGGVLEPGNSIGTLTVTDNFTLNGGTWQVEVNNAGDADKIIADDATLTSGSLVAVPTQAITDTQTYTILQTTSGIAGDPANLTKISSNTVWLLDYTVEISGNDLLLHVEQASVNIVDAVDPLNQPQLNDIAEIFDNALDNNLGGSQIASLQGMTQKQLQQVVEQSRPQIQQAGNQVLRQQQRTITSSLSSRQQSMQVALRNAERVRQANQLADAGPDNMFALSSAMQAIRDAMPTIQQWTPWARSLNDWGNLDGDTNASGYDWRTNGFDTGVEMLADENVLLGASFAALWSSLSGDNGSGSSDVTTIYGNLYASYITHDWHVDGGLTYGHAWTDNQRPVTAASVTADGEYDSNIFGGYLGGGYVFTFGEWDVEPTLYFEYTHVADDGYTETGAGSFNQTMHDNNTDSLRQSLGVRVARSFDAPGPGTMRARFAATWEHEYLDHQVVTSVDLLGGTFTSRGVDVSRETARLSAGLDWLLKPGVTLFADYTASLNEDWQNHSVNAGIRFDF